MAEVTDRKIKQQEPNLEATQQEVQDEVPQIKVQLTVGMLENGRLFFATGGDATLLNIQGLISYAQKYLDTMWEKALTPAPPPEQQQ